MGTKRIEQERPQKAANDDDNSCTAAGSGRRHSAALSTRMTATRSTAEAAQILGVSPSTVRRRIASGELEAITVNGNRRIPVAALEAATNPPTRAEHLAGDLSRLPALLDARTLAPILGMSVDTVWYHIRQGHLPSRKFGRRVLVTTAAIAKIVDAG
jgi:excisionase family DNA binding protein